MENVFSEYFFSYFLPLVILNLDGDGAFGPADNGYVAEIVVVSMVMLVLFAVIELVGGCSGNRGSSRCCC